MATQTTMNSGRARPDTRISKAKIYWVLAVVLILLAWMTFSLGLRNTIPLVTPQINSEPAAQPYF